MYLPNYIKYHFLEKETEYNHISAVLLLMCKDKKYIGYYYDYILNSLGSVSVPVAIVATYIHTYIHTYMSTNPISIKFRTQKTVIC